MRVRLLPLLLLVGCAEQQPQLTSITGPSSQKVQPPGLPGDADRTRPPPPGPNPKVVLPAPHRFQLEGGTKVLLVERHTLPIVAMTMVWPFGALEDPPDRPGMAALCADMLDEGAGGRGPLELAEAVSHLGARLETRATFNGTFINMQFLARHLPASLRLFADVVRRPAITDKELQRVKADTLTELRQRYDAPATIAGDLLEAVLYGQPHRRSAPVIGTLEAVKLLDHYDCRWWHRERLRPDDATLIIVGDVEPQSLKVLLGAELSGWRPPPRRKELPPLPRVPTPTQKVVAVEAPGQGQTVIAIGEPGVPRNHPEHFPLLIMNAILGGQFNSRINTNLRERNGFSYGSNSDFTFARDGGPFVIRASVKGESTRAAVAELLKEIGALRKELVTQDELRQAKDYLVRSMGRRFETVWQVAAELAAIEVFALPESYLQTYADRVEAVTADDVLRVAQQYLDPGRMTVALVGERRDIDKLAGMGLPGIEYRLVNRDGK
jgi:predicted Zn-dependent peptidase